MQERANGGMIEDRGGRYIQGPDGKMQGSLPNPKLTGNAAAGDTSGNLLDDDNLAAYMEPQKNKYAKSPQRSKKGIQIGAKQYNRLCSQMMANYQNLEAGERVCLRDGNKAFTVEADGSGGFTIKKITVKNGRR